MSSLIGLCDANNFYVSCERVFQPKLEGKPVVVLSNNDSCIVARSNEAKAIGIKMGAPLHQIQPTVVAHNVEIFSSNYTLYGDISQRVMISLEHFIDEVEVYSIDEAFLRFGDAPHSVAQDIRQAIKQWTGIPVSIGIAPTKTLAKVANAIAKRQEGVYLLQDPEPVLASLPVNDLWGIGPRLARRLYKHRIQTALALRNAELGLIQQELGIVGVRIVQELRGIPCLPLTLCPSPRKSCCVSRSFGRPIETMEEMKEAVATYASRAAVKLRRDRLHAGAIAVSISTNRFHPEEPQYGNTLSVPLPYPTHDTVTLVRVALRLTEVLFKKGFRYKKAGVLLTELSPEDERQLSFWMDSEDVLRRERLMEVVDTLNKRFGRDTIFCAAEGLRKEWQMRSRQRSPQYTTKWDELLTIQ